MFTIFVVLHLIVSVILILVVLLQSGKAGDLASAFGGAGSQTAFGTRSAATFLTKATATCAALFMITSLGLSIMGSSRQGSIMQDVPVAKQAAPAAAAGAGSGGTTKSDGAPAQPQPENRPSAEGTPEKPPANQ